MAPTWRALATIGTLVSAASMAHAEDYLRSTSFTNCESSNQVNASDFGAAITPENNTIAFDISATITFTGNATLDFSIIINGNETQLFRQDPCAGGDPELCPTSPGQLVLSSNINIPKRVSDVIPEEVYTSANPDAQFKLSFNNTATGQPFGCLLANLTNGAAEALGTNSTSSTNNTSTSGSSAPNATNGTNATGEQGSQNSATIPSIMSTLAIGVPAVIGLTLWL